MLFKENDQKFISLSFSGMEFAMTEKNQHLNDPLNKDFVSTEDGKVQFLILHNDEIHTFDYVIESLIDVCQHEPEQAEQCALIAHYKGQCDVRKGTRDILSPMREGLTERGLTATID